MQALLTVSFNVDMNSNTQPYVQALLVARFSVVIKVRDRTPNLPTKIIPAKIR